MSRDYVIIVGAMKSGTTTLFDILAVHPQIAPASDKEPGFFAFEDIWQKGFEWFDTLFDFDPVQHRYRLEASTDYTKMPFVDGVWDRMQANPDVRVKLIYIMRHPFRRIESHARHVQTAKKELGQQISPRPDHGLDAGISEINLACSRYAEQLDSFSEARAAGNLHCLTLEQLMDNPRETLAAVYDFLDLPPGSFDLPVSNAATDRTRTHPLYRRLSRMRGLMALGRALLPQGLRDRLRDKFRQKVRAEGRFALTETETDALLDSYLDDLRRLRDDYGIDIARYWDLHPNR